jgi:phosphoglycerate dehydrogenase-like enzyme
MTTDRPETIRNRPTVGLACSEPIFATYIDPADVRRLETRADFVFQPFSLDSNGLRPVPRDSAAEDSLARFAASLDVLVVAHGCPFVSDDVLRQATRLSLLGELEGDRFAHRLSVDAAAARGLTVVDTSHGSSWPTAEWALALALIGLRNAGALFRRIIAHQPGFRGGVRPRSGPGYDGAELSGKQVGLIGFGHLGRRLAELLGPFGTDIVAYDPFVPRELAAAYGITFGPLAAVMARDVVFTLVPLTRGTAGMIGAKELSLLRPGAVFVNVSRGAVVDSQALIGRLADGDVIACLDVFDPEPLPVDSPIVDFPNVFLSPHVAGVTEESRRRFFALMVSEIIRHLDGLEPLTELTPHVVSLRLNRPPRTDQLPTDPFVRASKGAATSEGKR